MRGPPESEEEGAWAARGVGGWPMASAWGLMLRATGVVAAGTGMMVRPGEWMCCAVVDGREKRRRGIIRIGSGWEL